MSKIKPKVSIIMGIYNCEDYLRDSIESIINQTYNNWELIMCDDGSIDHTLEIAKEYKDKYPDKIVVVKNDKNKGLNYTLNRCITLATGDYIGRQDGDDISLPNRLEVEMNFLLKNPEYSLVSSNMLFFDSNGVWGESHNFGEVKKENFIQGSPICHAPCIIKKQALLNVGCYTVKKSLLRVEDYHLWFKFFIAGYKCYNLKESLYKMRDDSNAYKRRNLKNRINETKLKLWGFSKIGIPVVKYIWAFKPVVSFLIPKKFYMSLHKSKLKPKYNSYGKIKVAQFVGLMNCGGSETMLMNLFDNIDKEKYEITFIENEAGPSWYSEEIKLKGGKIVKVDNPTKVGMIKYIKQLINVFKTGHYDVVHSHVFLHSGIVMYAAKKANVPIRISHSHSAMNKDDNNIIKMFALRTLILKYSTNLVACSTEAGICLFGNKFLKIGRVLPNPIKLNDIKNVTSDSVNKLKLNYNISNDCLILGHVGRLVQVKNHDFLFEIAKHLKENGIVFKMFFLGEGPLHDEIQSKIIDYNLEKNIFMTGNVKNVYEYMRMFDILLLPSFYEGLPVTLIEAQASGLYSIVSNKVSKESDLGLGLVDFENINDCKTWVNKIVDFKPIDVNIEKIYKTIIRKKYSSDILVKEYEKMYLANDRR